MKLKNRQFNCLAEALRRCAMHPSEPIVKVWTGLGSYTTYKSTIDAGFMEYIHSPNPSYIQWFRLTEKGAKIVQNWIDKGYSNSFNNFDPVGDLFSDRNYE